MADDIRALLEAAYGPASADTSDVLKQMPERDRWAGAFSDKGMRTVADILRSRQGGLLTPDQVKAGMDEPHKDILSALLPAAQPAAAAAYRAIPDEAWLASAFLGVGPKTPPRSLKALEKAKEIAASEQGTPGQRTEKAWKAGGQYGGWDQIPVRIGAEGVPEMEWARWMPTFDTSKPSITAYDGRPSSYDNRGWFGRHKTDVQKGTVGELTNLNPALLKEFPDVADIPLTLKRGYDEYAGGHLRPGGWFSKEKIGVTGSSDKDLAESLAHEIGHALARRQGWSTGSDPSAEKRPWIAKGNDMKHYGDTAFDRYLKGIGEQVAELDARLNMNERYGKDYGERPKTFPSYESIPQEQQRGKKYMIERSLEGRHPQELPPSWQFTSRLDEMRNPTTPWQNVFWHWPADLLKSLGAGYGISQLDKLFPEKKKEAQDIPVLPEAPY